MQFGLHAAGQIQYKAAVGAVGHPPRYPSGHGSFREGKLTLEELCRLYCTRVYARVGSYVQTARRLKIDRRTVKKYVADK